MENPPELTKRSHLKEFTKVFGSQENYKLDAQTLDNLLVWWTNWQNTQKSPYLPKPVVIQIQPFGLIDGENSPAMRPDKQNVQTTKAYLDEIIIHLNQFKNPCVVVITGNGGWQEEWTGGEAISTALYLAKKLGKDWQKKYFLIPCGASPVENSDYVNNLLTAKSILAQIKGELKIDLEFESLWTDTPRFYKHLILCLVLGVIFLKDWDKVKTAKRVEIDNEGKLKNQNLELARQNIILGIVLWHLFQDWLKNKPGKNQKIK